MTEWTSISVTEAQKEQLEREKPDGMAMGAFLVSLIDSNSNGGESREEIIQDIRKQLDQIQSAQGDTVSEALKLAESDSDVDFRPVLNRIDDLETELKTDLEALRR